MFRPSHASRTVATVLILLAGGVCAQEAPAAPVNCTDAESIAFNATQLAGRWFEVARNPAPPTTKACIQVDIQDFTQHIQIEVTYADDSKLLHSNKTMSANMSANATAGGPDGYNVTYSVDATSSPVTTYKLLATDYNNYAFVCGYTNANASEFAVVLTRDRMPNATLLNSYESMAAADFSNFLNGSMAQITQSSDCFKSSGATLAFPVLSSILVAISALPRLVN